MRAISAVKAAQRRAPPDEVVGQAHLGRREAMALLAALAALRPAPGWAQAPLDKVAFLDASSLVTGMEKAKLTGLTDALLAVFQPQAPVVLDLAIMARGAQPADLGAAIKGTPMEPVAKALAAAWYTGTVGSGATATLLSYEDAVAWKAAGYAAVPGLCAGDFGFWSQPPAPI